MDSARPRPVLAGLIISLLLVALAVAFLLYDLIPGLPLLVVFAAGAWSLWRQRAWGGYGLALFLAAGCAGSVARALTLLDTPELAAGMALTAVTQGGLAFVQFGAGAALARPGSSAGIAPHAWSILAAAAAVAIISFRPFAVPTTSMEPTLLRGDEVLVRTLGSVTPSRGTLVAFRYPVDPRQMFLKRVIGLPRDRIRITRKKLSLNGVPQTEPYAINLTDYLDSYRDNFPSEPNVRLFPVADEMLAKQTRDGEVIVPEGKLFVLGDNRDSSLDSRYWGFVDRSQLIGVAVLLLSSHHLPETAVSGQHRGSIFSIRWDRVLKRL